ncbi:MAG TPA: hypothetical protein VHF06_31860, partial [Pseudonocardiaceae bacterium]|nr:hypothetical protein [Pseudonocardiaceae bacterium]
MQRDVVKDYMRYETTATIDWDSQRQTEVDAVGFAYFSAVGKLSANWSTARKLGRGDQQRLPGGPVQPHHPRCEHVPQPVSGASGRTSGSRADRCRAVSVAGSSTRARGLPRAACTTASATDGASPGAWRRSSSAAATSSSGPTAISSTRDGCASSRAAVTTARWPHARPAAYRMHSGDGGSTQCGSSTTTSAGRRGVAAARSSPSVPGAHGQPCAGHGRSQRERPGQRGRLPRRQCVAVLQDRREEIRQRGEPELGLGRHTGRAQHRDGVARLAGQRCQQGRLPDPRFTAHQQAAAPTARQIGEQRVEPLDLVRAPDDGAGRVVHSGVGRFRPARIHGCRHRSASGGYSRSQAITWDSESVMRA